MRAPANPQVRFLLRASTLLLAMLAMWWWVLLPPMLAGLRLSTDVVLRLLTGGSSAASATVDDAGDWVLRVPVPASLMERETVQRAFGRAPGSPPVKVRSFKLATTKAIPTFFTLTFPLYWALTLAAPWFRRWWRAAVGGTALLAVVAELSLLLYTVFTIGSRMQLIGPNSLWGAAEYLNINVVSYVTPFLLALWLHEELRAQIFSWDAPPAPAIADPAPAVDKPRRGRYRGR